MQQVFNARRAIAFCELERVGEEVDVAQFKAGYYSRYFPGRREEIMRILIQDTPVSSKIRNGNLPKHHRLFSSVRLSV
jgi:hypothetical protein